MTSAGALKAREALSLTQREMGLLLGVDSVTVSRWERSVLKVPRHQAALMHAMLEAARLVPERVSGVRGLLLGVGMPTALVVALGGKFDQ